MALKPTQLPTSKTLRQQRAEEIESIIDSRLAKGKYKTVGKKEARGYVAELPSLAKLLKKYGVAIKVTFEGGTFRGTDSNTRRMIARRYVSADWSHVLFDAYQGTIYAAYLFK